MRWFTSLLLDRGDVSCAMQYECVIFNQKIDSMNADQQVASIHFKDNLKNKSFLFVIVN